MNRGLFEFSIPLQVLQLENVMNALTLLASVCESENEVCSMPNNLAHADDTVKSGIVLQTSDVDYVERSSADGSLLVVQTSDVDARNMPWDKRIHGGQKTKNKNGTWKYRKNIDKTIIPSVEAEIEVTSDDDEAISYQTVFQAASTAMSKGTLKKAQLDKILKKCGFKKFNELESHPDKFKSVMNALSVYMPEPESDEDDPFSDFE